jgi:hypothetical protein
MTATPQAILHNFDEETLVYIAEKCGKTLSKQQKSKAADILKTDIIQNGVKKVLEVLRVAQLKLLMGHPQIDLAKEMEAIAPKRGRSKSPSREKKKRNTTSSSASKSPKKNKFPSKQVMIKILSDKIFDVGPKKFLNQLETPVLLECCKDIDDLSDYSKEDLIEIEKKELIEAIISNINRFGLEHLFSLFSVKELSEFCQKLELDCDETNSKDALIEAILEHKTYKKPKQKKKEVKASENAPEIKEGITKVDLQAWFKREQLSEWLRNKGAKVSGKKKELVVRILKYLEGDREHTMPNPHKKRGKKKKKCRKI